MRAAYCTAPHRIELRDVPEPVPAAGEVLVRVAACGICGSDLHYFSGAAPPPPVCLGHEIVGHMASAAAGFAAGDPVVIEPLLACGRCQRCRAGQPNLCPQLRILGSMAPGGFAELVAVPESTLFRVPPGLPVEAAMLAEPLAVGVHASHVAAVGAGERVLIIGAGAIGLLAAFAAVQAGGAVTVSARHPHQADAACTLGAEVVGAEPDAVRTLSAAAPPDVVLETVGGAGTTLDLALEVVRPGGRIVALGKFTQPIVLPPLRFLMKEPHLTSSMTYCRRGARPDFTTALALLAAHPVLATLVTHAVPLADTARGFALAADKRSGALKVAVTRA
ncbi:MAG TPA: alcohol dehydrogenase catalytic domain-containing protein [Candidatus Binatia bacterium]|jgi:2-desacetyl-2-hydroxyethyl bacteriochlorophyllide A dehydrogenase